MISFLRTIHYVLNFVALSWLLGFIWFDYYVYNYPIDNNAKADGIVVLTGGKGRIAKGLNLLDEGVSEYMLISGAAPTTDIKQLKKISTDKEAALLDKLQKKIYIGHLATNTHQNAIESSVWVKLNKFKSIILVTSSYHIPRSLIEFKKQLPDVKIIPYSVQLDQDQTHKENILITLWHSFYEYNKYLIIYMVNTGKNL